MKFTLVLWIHSFLVNAYLALCKYSRDNNGCDCLQVIYLRTITFERYFSGDFTKTKSRESVGPIKNGNDLVSDNKGMTKIHNKCLTSVFVKGSIGQVPNAVRCLAL